jgi:hypothetical protein
MYILSLRRADHSSKESYQPSISVRLRNLIRGGQGTILAAAPLKKICIFYIYIYICKYNIGTFDTILVCIMLAINETCKGLILVLKTLLHLMEFYPNFTHIL